MMKKLFLFLALLLPIGAWANEVLVASQDWVTPWFDNGGTNATCALTADGIAITNPKVQTDMWTPQTEICVGNLTLKKDHYYIVRLTIKVPSNGTYFMHLGSWESNDGCDFTLNASDDFQVIDLKFDEYHYNLDDAHVLFQSGYVKGTTVIQNVQVLDVTNDETLLVEKNWISPFWFDDGGTGATCEMVADGVAITNPKVQSELYTPQTEVLQGAKLEENHTYKVIVEAKIPSNGELQVNMGNGDFQQQYSVPVTASKEFQNIEVMFNDFPETLDNVRVLFQNGGIKGISIVRYVQINDLGDIPVPLKYRYNPDEETATVIKDPDRKYKGAVAIPSIVEHNDIIYTVTEISDDAFQDCVKLTSITIPATVTKFHGWAFLNCTSLQQIIVNPNNPEFDSRDDCNAIIQTADNKVVVGCETTVIPNGITRIGTNAFWGRWGMKSMTIPETVKEIGEGAFAFCISLRNANLPSSIEKIEGGAFAFCDLRSVTLPATLTDLEPEAFRNCENLESVVIPDNLEEIPDSCFKYCAKLESIDLKNVKKIGGGAFASTGLTSLVLPASVKEVCHEAFGWCPIATLDLGQVEKVGPAAFISNNMEELTIPATLIEADGESFSWNFSMKKAIFEDGCTKVFDTMFHGNENLSEVFLPYTITEIQPRAFQSCKSLTRITIPERVEKIGEQAFNLCDALTEVTIESPVPPVLDGTEAISNRAKATLNVPRGSRTAYEAAEYWKEFGMIVNVLAEENWDGPYWFSEDGGATYKMTSEGIAISNPKVQEEAWNPQSIVLQNARLQKNHTYKVIVTAKIPSDGTLRVELGSWGKGEVHAESMSVQASSDFQDYEFTYNDFPVDADDGHVLFQNGHIKGTSVVRSIQVLDITNGEEMIAEKNWASPYWFADEGTGATFTMTDEGLAIKNPKVQNEVWTPQTMILKNAKLQKNHSYKVIVNAKIPSDGDLQMQLGSWASDVYEHQCIAVNASSDFQDLEFIYRDFPADAEDGFVVFQNGFIAGTSIVRSVRILDMGDNPVDLVYSYNEEDHTAEVINNDNGKYKGDVIIPSTVKHNGEDYTVTKINDDAFADCTTLRSITIPETVTELSGWGFRNCASLEQITVVPNNPRFNSNNNCNAIIETGENKLIVGSLGTVIPEGITRIGAHAFWGRWGLETINIPNSVKEIGNHAFSWCFLNEITLPSELEVLEDGAFASTDLQSIILPASLKTIGKEAFNDCPKLTNVTVQNSVPLELDGGETFSNRANATLSLPAGAKKAYKAAPIWKEFKETVEAEHNTVYSYDLTAYLGVPTEMDINLENWDPFTAYQFDIVLPDGITLEKKADGKGIKFTKGKRCAGSRSISVTARDNNTYRVICISTKNEVITGNDGALLTVYLVANENMGMKTCQAEIKNVIMTTPEEKQVNFDPTTVTITTKTLLLGDSNDDEFVNVTDLVATINYILGRPSDKFNKTAADISKNHVVDIFDVNLGLGLIKNGSRGARMMARAAEAANDKMTVRDLSISSGMTKQLQVELTNEASYTGFQFDLVLPEGIKMTSYSTTARIPEDMIVDYNETEGVYRFLGGLGETAISGNSGSIINITVKADENLKGRYLTGYLRDVKLSMATGDGPTIEETPFKITDETSGDLNKNGKLDPADVKAIVELIMTGEYKTKADVNGDSKVDATDIVIVTNEIK